MSSEKSQLCGCGRPVRYIVQNGDGTADSCNKYMRCPTWDELHEQNQELRGKLGQYETLMKLFKTCQHNQELHAVVVSVFGGIGAMSPELYEEALRRVAEQCGRVVDEMFRNEVTEQLRQMPCPFD